MEPEKKSNGALIGLIIIILLLVIGGVYVWQSNKNTTLEVETPLITEKDSTDLETMEASLETTDTNIGIDVTEVE